jgi:hypothetical protein
MRISVLIRVWVFVMLAATVQAQQGRPMQRIHAAKMAYISDRLQLSESQSAQFMPTYRAYEEELRTIRKPYKEKYKLRADDEGSTASAWQYLEDDLDYQQDVIALKRKYNDRFLKVLSPQQLADMYVAEREFKRVLMKRLEERRGGPGRRRR